MVQNLALKMAKIGPEPNLTAYKYMAHDRSAVQLFGPKSDASPHTKVNKGQI